MAYILGLRHALDADHIAAIDNVSRSLLGRGERATSVGLFFALGHSTVVTGASLAVGVAAIRMSAAFEQARAVAAVYSTLISVTVLIAIAPRNAWAAWRIYKGEESTLTSAPRGLVSRVVRPILGFRLKSWQMFFVGALFGLGFETATAVALLGLSAAQASGGVSLASTMVFPLLFTAGMTLVDALDGIFMERAYGWALQDSRRHARYNLAVTSLSVLVAALVGGFELASVAHHAWGAVLPGAVMLEVVENHFEEIGAAIIIVFVVGWIVAIVKEKHDEKRFREAASRQPSIGGLPIEAAE
jgi:high-affinity nickel-transport protein